MGRHRHDLYREGAQVRIAVREHPDSTDEEGLGHDPLRMSPGPGTDALAPAVDDDDTPG